MLFSSSLFIFIFLPVALGGYYLFPSRFRNVFLLIASLAFYAFGEPLFVLVMMASIVINYFAALLLDRSKSEGRRKLILIGGIIINGGLLFVFKYLNFFTENLNRIWPQVTVTSIALPIGISFFTFQAMSYIIDVYRGEKVQKNLLDLGLYIAFFPQLIAGPIVRYKSIAEEIKNRTETWEDFSEGTVRFLGGLAKKIIFANSMAVIADKAFSGTMSEHSVLFAWLGALAYTLQIYFDFSGYSDMAIGLGRMFGFHFMENFNYPYAAESITDFWRRWHISLSSWFRDYVYIPLGGSRGGTLKTIRNLFIVWLLTGIWHGANWTFIAWGLAYFVLLLLEKYVIKPERFRAWWLKWGYRLLTFVAVSLCWVIFRSESIAQAGEYIKSMLGLYGNPFADGSFLWFGREYIALLIPAMLFATPLVRKLLGFIKLKIKPGLYGTFKWITYIGLFLVSVSCLVIGAHNPFIYFHF